MKNIIQGAVSDRSLEFQLPLSHDLAQACARIVAPTLVEDDPFDANPMLAIPTFRFTRSAPPTPSRKTAIERHIGYYMLAPSLSMPIDMDLRIYA